MQDYFVGGRTGERPSDFIKTGPDDIAYMQFWKNLQTFQQENILYDNEATLARSTLSMKSKKSLHKRKYFPVGVHFVVVCLLATTSLLGVTENFQVATYSNNCKYPFSLL